MGFLGKYKLIIWLLLWFIGIIEKSLENGVTIKYYNGVSINISSTLISKPIAFLL